jgi:hypothetical protein
MFDWHKAYFQSENPKLAITRGTMATLASHANFTLMTCYPSQTRLAALSSQSVRTTKRHIDLNIEAGWLTIVTMGSSSRRATVYLMTIPEGTPDTHDRSTPDTHDRSTPVTSVYLTTDTTIHENTDGLQTEPRTELLSPMTGVGLDDDYLSAVIASDDPCTDDEILEFSTR